MKAKGVDSGGGRRLQQQLLPRQKNEATAAAASTAASGPVGMRAAFLLRRTKIMEFSGTNQNTPMGRNIKNKKGPFDQSFLYAFCASCFPPPAGFLSCAVSLHFGRSFFSHFMFYFSLLRLSLFFYSLFMLPSFSCHHITAFIASTLRRRTGPKIQADLHTESLLFFSITSGQ